MISTPGRAANAAPRRRQHIASRSPEGRARLLALAQPTCSAKTCFSAQGREQTRQGQGTIGVVFVLRRCVFRVGVVRYRLQGACCSRRQGGAVGERAATSLPVLVATPGGPGPCLVVAPSGRSLLAAFGEPAAVGWGGEPTVSR